MFKALAFVVSAFAVMSLVILLGRIACAPVNLAHTALTSAENVAKKTLDADNVIHNYEWFHDVDNQVKSRVSQIAAHREILSGETDGPEKRSLRIELAAMQQSCRDLVAQYNANSTKINRNIFRGRTAPEALDSNICE